jgi:hypothetical protein
MRLSSPSVAAFIEGPAPRPGVDYGMMGPTYYAVARDATTAARRSAA